MSAIQNSDDIRVTVNIELPDWSVSEDEIRLVESHFENLLVALIQQTERERFKS